MGLRKIAELRAELRKKADVLEQFTKAVAIFVETHAKIAASYEALEKLRRENLAKVKALPTLDIKEFEAYKKSLEAVYSGWGGRPLPMAPLKAVVDKQKKEVDDAVNARVAKLAAMFPAKVQKGMLFRFEPTKVYWEIISDAYDAPNKTLKGDDKIFYGIKTDGGGSSSTSLTTLKKSCKFIRV